VESRVKAHIDEASHACHEKEYDKGAQMLIDAFIKNRMKVNPGEGEAYLQKLIPGMISRGMHVDVAHVLWGSTLFNPEPESVQRIWSAVQRSATLLIPGAGSVGKSYNLAAYYLLDWLEDPLWTCVKVVSATQEHALKNVFAHIKNLHRQSSVVLPGIAKAHSIQASLDEKQGIHLVAIPAGDTGAGRLQGFHPTPRKIEHQKFGKLSRIRAILDEAEGIPQGVWDDVDNMLISIFDIEHIKIGAAANPRDIDSKFGLRCKPVGGWQNFDIETSLEWESEYKWTVVRLDGARCENVLQKKMVYPGMLSYDGYKRYLIQGDTSPEYFTMARGAFPAKGLAINVIPRDFMSRAIAQLRFTGPVTYCAAADLAFEGGDKAVLTVGRFGMATGYNINGQIINFEKPKFSLQAESQFELIKEDPSHAMTQTPWLVKQIKEACRSLSIKDKWLICDRTGNGTGVHDILRSNAPDGLGEDVIGIHYGAKATDLKLFSESQEKASDIYDGIVTELFFATRNYLEFDYLKISPSLNVDRLSEELCTRRFKPGGKNGKVRVEGKKEYKARTLQDSPDFADSLTMLVHLVRMREGIEAVLLATTGSYRDQPEVETVVDVVPYMQWK
jgi:hypothetical protein